MLELPHDGPADMIADIRPMLGVTGLRRRATSSPRRSCPRRSPGTSQAVGRRTRELPGVELGASSRSLIHLASAARAIARLAGRDTVTVEDIQEIAPYVIRHRLIVDPRVDPDDVLREALESGLVRERERVTA
jgi:MoxR-like ATPase